MTPPLDAARLALKRHFGYDDFRPGQVDVVDAVLSGRNTLGVLPTGGGKSLCYQVPALVLPGLTIVISPLISLMKDQVDRLVARGVSAAFLNSTLTSGETSRRLLSAERGILKLLYVAPERFESADLARALARCTLALLAVDEAHCISEWGHEFRPSFRRIADVCARLGNPQIIALTATATPHVRQDIVRQLRMREPRVVVSGFDRPSLHYSVTRCATEAQRDENLLSALRSHSRPSIVYASTRGAVDRMARRLKSGRMKAAAYHGGLDGDERRAVQDAFMRGQIETIVATNAFGMGIDKPDVRLVVHYAMPGTLEAYYQEAGRAGRDGGPAHCTLLYRDEDRRTHEWFIRSAFPPRAAIESVYAALRAVQLRGRVPDDPGAIARRCAQTSQGDVIAALRFLQQRGAIVQKGSMTTLRVRLLATPARIRRELLAPPESPELGTLRALWRLGGTAFLQGRLMDVDGLAPGLGGQVGRAALETLRNRQFVDYDAPHAGLHLANRAAPLDRFAIDWDAWSRRREAEIAKLDMMEGYTRTTKCRRHFVLTYFGERVIERGCRRCDNCQSL